MAYGSATVLRTVRPGAAANRGSAARLRSTLSTMSEQPTSIFSEIRRHQSLPGLRADRHQADPPAPGVEPGDRRRAAAAAARGRWHLPRARPAEGVRALGRAGHQRVRPVPAAPSASPRPITLAWLTGIGELVGGAFVVLGAVTPLAAAGLLGIMINVVLLKLGNGFFIAGPAGAGRLRAGAGARAGRGRPGAHRPGPDRPGQRPRLAPPPGLVGRALPGHRRRRGGPDPDPAARRPAAPADRQPPG